MDVVIKGVRPYDGTYPAVLIDDMTRGDWRWVKKLTGYMPLTFQDGLQGGDPDVFGAMAVIAMLRSGRITEDDIPNVWDRLTAANAVDSVDVQGDPEEEPEDDAGPPETKPEESTTSSGPSTETASETSEPNPPATGTHNSGSLESDRVMSRA